MLVDQKVRGSRSFRPWLLTLGPRTDRASHAPSPHHPMVAQARVLAVSRNTLAHFRREPESLMDKSILDPGALFDEASAETLRLALEACDRARVVAVPASPAAAGAWACFSHLCWLVLVGPSHALNSSASSSRHAARPRTSPSSIRSAAFASSPRATVPRRRPSSSSSSTRPKKGAPPRHPGHHHRSLSPDHRNEPAAAHHAPLGRHIWWPNSIGRRPCLCLCVLEMQDHPGF